MVDLNIFEFRVRLVRSLLGPGAEQIVLQDPSTLNWLTGGGRTYVEHDGVGVAAICIRRNAVTVHTTSNELDRLREEELAGADVFWRASAWDDGFISSLPRGKGVITDRPGPEETGIGDKVLSLQFSLSQGEAAAYRQTGPLVGAALTEAIRGAVPDMTERQLAAHATASLATRGFRTTALLVAGESRIDRFRHPLPTDQAIGRRGLVAACVERDGLVYSITRMFCFGRARTSIRRRYENLLQVEAVFLDHSRAGSTIGEAFAAGVEAYASNGFASNEYLNHHQGGRTGYRSRYYLATSGSHDEIGLGEALAWNPTGPGLKIEDTVIIDAAGPVPVTTDVDWPALEIADRSRPNILELN